MIDMKYRKISLLALTLAASAFCVSCEDMWKEKTTNKWDEKYIWTVAEIAQGVLNRAYESMPDTPAGYNGTFLDAATDNAVTNNYSSSVYELASGNLSIKNNPIGDWETCYNALQNINLFLENGLTDNTLYDREDPNQDQAYKKRLYGEAHFLRAYWGFRLLQMYGGRTDAGNVLGYPLTIHFVTENAAGHPEMIKRDSYEACVEQIMKDCDVAIANLPASYSGTDLVTGNTNVGRANALAAGALKSRVALYAASPAYQNKDCVQINGMGQYSILDDAAYRKAWEEAAKIANDVINMDGFDKEFYALQPSDLADVANTTPSEFLMRVYFNSKSLETNHFPPYYLGKAYTEPTQNFVDAFPMINGFPIDDPQSGYDADNPYANRDKRLDLNVYYHGRVYGNTGYPINIIDGAKDSPSFDPNASRSGYYLAKFISKKETMLDPMASANAAHYNPIFRRAEVFLNYAEAANEAWGPKGNPEGYTYSAYDVIKTIREKSGGITNTEYLDAVADAGKDEFRKLIHNERRLELAFESHRYFDMRRCLMVLNEPVYGVTVKESNGKYVYDTRVYLEDRKFDDIKYYYAPIPYEECIKNPDMVNNLGWK